jgi:uncharacterized protein YjgD (DUF1641 family)|tara:strand:- start:584 stop:967 length:384 start_codon:yes stop_codon:yes gene_type:complete
MTTNKLQYEIQENKGKHQENKEEIDSLINNESFFSDFEEEFEYFDSDNVMAQQMDYNQNYNINKLHHIINYYNLPKRKLKKEELIDSIVQFENAPENSAIVYNRKRLWHYLNELKNDSYFGKFVIFN